MDNVVDEYEDNNIFVYEDTDKYDDIKFTNNKILHNIPSPVLIDKIESNSKKSKNNLFIDTNIPFEANNPLFDNNNNDTSEFKNSLHKKELLNVLTQINNESNTKIINSRDPSPNIKIKNKKSKTSPDIKNNDTKKLEKENCDLNSSFNK